MLKILFCFFILLVKMKNSYELNYDIIETKDEEIEAGISKTYFLDFNVKKKFIFNIEKDSLLQINIFTINCNIDIEPKNKTIYQMNLNIYSLELDSNKNNITVTPLIDIVDGVYKENYEQKHCPLVINSYYILNSTKQKLNIDNKNENFFYFNSSINNDIYNISYNIKKISNNSFISLSFRLQDIPFLVNISYINNKKQEKSISKYVNGSTFIYLDSEFLLYDKKNLENNGTLFIDIQNLFNESTFMFFKIIEKDNIFSLVKNELNFGFITSKTTYQYYHTEILKGEEGELMLHNKRVYGILYAKILNKNDSIDLNDISIYPHEKNETDVEYNEHKLQLKFNYKKTNHCLNGCILLITYKQIKSEEDFPLIGYEYTILSRFWNSTDYNSKIINLFFNEYFISCFGQGASNEHYYSIYIPNDAEKIIMQIEGKGFKAFYEKGRKKINTNSEETNRINLNQSQSILSLDIPEIEDSLSFAFRPEDYNKIFSYYYFRLIYIRKNETKYLNMDSNLGNLCMPEINQSNGYYYCYFLLKNDYDELKNKFVVSSTNQNEYVKIYISIVYKNKSTSDEINCFNYFVYDKNNSANDIDYFMFKFEFKNSEIKNIISSFCDRVENIYPQIYSVQMHYLDKFTKINRFKLENNYLFKYQFICGESGIFNISLFNFDFFNISQNFKGRHIIIPVDNETNKFSFSTDSNEHIFLYQLIYNMNNKGIEEVKTEECVTYILPEILLPLYYYIKIKNRNYTDIIFNLRLKNYKEFELNTIYSIEGYIITKDILNRKINGEYIQLTNPIKGFYKKAFGLGFLQVNQKIDNNNSDKYLLIEMNNPNKAYLNISSKSLIEISAKENEKNEIYTLPPNKYILETFNDDNDQIRNVNEYYIFKPNGNINKTLIELSTEYKEINMQLENGKIINNKINEEAGFMKYSIINIDNDKLQFKVINNNKTKAYYMIRYSYQYINYSNFFIFDEKYSEEIIYYEKDFGPEVRQFASVSLTFNNIKGINSYIKEQGKGIYYLITGTLYQLNEENTKINTNYILNEINPIYINKTTALYDQSNWTLVFNDISRISNNSNYIYDLQIQVGVVLFNNILNEECLIFKTKVDLSEIKNDSSSIIIFWTILGIVIIIILFLAIFFFIKFIRLKKKNSNLRQEMISLAFSNDIQKNVLINEKKFSKKESDYETTFI